MSDDVPIYETMSRAMNELDALTEALKLALAALENPAAVEINVHLFDRNIGHGTPGSAVLAKEVSKAINPEAIQAALQVAAPALIKRTRAASQYLRTMVDGASAEPEIERAVKLRLVPKE